MAKCTQCATRKGKRHCPALSEGICARCCANERLQTIQCPEDCPHLQSEMYQHQRRKDRASSQGREFLETNRELFPREEAFNFAFKLQADVYYFCAHEAVADDEIIARCIDSLKALYSPIYVPESSPHPLLAFLRKRLEDTYRYPPDREPRKEERLRIFRVLGKHIASLGGSGSQRYWETLSSFFAELDFESDLDYSPLDSRDEQAPDEPRRSPGGLILPP